MRQELRSVLSSDMFRQTKLTYTGVARALDKIIQCARYEEFMLSQASAYKGYNLDFPAGRMAPRLQTPMDTPTGPPSKGIQLDSAFCLL